MKLRVKGNSIRLRIARSELARLQAGERIEESVLFPTQPLSTLSYSLSVNSQEDAVKVGFVSNRISVTISHDQLTSWSGEHQVGIYASLPIQDDLNLEVSIEKDFACLDVSDEENKDTFVNPMAGSAC